MAKNKKVENLTPDQSTFTGGAFANFFRGLLSGFVTFITLGLAYPAMVCWRMRWEASHTYINGRRLVFDGKARQLFGNYIKWVLLSIITLGIYFLIKGRLLIIEWQTKHIHFEGVEADEENNQSHFDGKWYQLFGINFVANLVTVITLTIGFYWAHCYKERWYAKHKTIDGHTMYFDGTGMQYFGKRILWTLLTVVTLGIYSFWLIVKSKKWTISHTFVEDAETLPPVSEMTDEEKGIKKPKPPKNKWAIAGFVCSVFGGLGALGMSVYFCFIHYPETLQGLYFMFAIGILVPCSVISFLSFDIIGFKRRVKFDDRGKKMSISGMVFAVLYIIPIICFSGVAFARVEMSLPDYVIEACPHSNAVYMQPKISCTEEGNAGYWYCKDCDGCKITHRWYSGIMSEYEDEWCPNYIAEQRFGPLIIPPYHNYFYYNNHNECMLLYCKNCGLRKTDEFQNEMTFDEFLNSYNTRHGNRILEDNYNKVYDAFAFQLRDIYPNHNNAALINDSSVNIVYFDENHDNKIEKIQVTFIVKLDTGERVNIDAILELDPVDVRYINNYVEQSFNISDSSYRFSWSHEYRIDFTGVVTNVETQIMNVD